MSMEERFAALRITMARALRHVYTALHRSPGGLLNNNNNCYVESAMTCTVKQIEFYQMKQERKHIFYSLHVHATLQ